MTPPHVLVVNGDDFGLTPGISIGILRAHEIGIVTSTSVLVGAPAFDDHAAALRDSGIGVGLHLCLVGEDPPLLTGREVPTLVDRRGRLPIDWRQFLRRAALGRIDPDDIERELSAQADKASGIGLQVHHIDAHQYLHLWPTVGARAVDLGRQLGAKVLRVAHSNRRSPVGFGVRTLGARLRREARAAGFVVPDHSGGLDRAGHLTRGILTREIVELGRRGGHADLAVHPGLAHDPQRARYLWGYEWAHELETLCDPDSRRVVQDAGFRLGSFAELADASTCV